MYGVTTGHYSNFFTQQLKYPRVEVPAGKYLSLPDAAEKINWTPKCFKTIAKVVNISVAILADLKLGVTKLLPVILEYLLNAILLLSF